MALTTAVTSKGMKKEDSAFTNVFKTAGYAIVYGMSKTKRLQQYEYFMCNPDLDALLGFYNAMDSVFMKRIFNRTLDSIKVCQKIYIPNLEDELTIGECNRLIDFTDVPEPKFIYDEEEEILEEEADGKPRLKRLDSTYH